jgi:importin subunit beta-1
VSEGRPSLVVIGILIVGVISGSNEANYRTAAYQAIAAYLSQATNDVLPVVSNILDTILTRMEHLIPIHVSHTRNWYLT